MTPSHNNLENRPRTSFTMAQTQVLEHAFNQTYYPSAAVKRAISNELHIPEDRVTVWFQNRRSRERRRSKKKYEAGNKVTTNAMPPSKRCPFSEAVPKLPNAVEFYEGQTWVTHAQQSCYVDSHLIQPLSNSPLHFHADYYKLSSVNFVSHPNDVYIAETSDRTLPANASWPFTYEDTSALPWWNKCERSTAFPDSKNGTYNHPLTYGYDTQTTLHYP